MSINVAISDGVPSGMRRLLQRCGLHLVHAIPTAWEWKFSAMPPQWVLVTLKEGLNNLCFGGYPSRLARA